MEKDSGSNHKDEDEQEEEEQQQEKEQDDAEDGDDQVTLRKRMFVRSYVHATVLSHSMCEMPRLRAPGRSCDVRRILRER